MKLANFIMEHISERIVDLMLRAQQDLLSAEEEADLKLWLIDHPYGRVVYQRLQEENRLHLDLERIQTIDIVEGWRRFQARIQTVEHPKKTSQLQHLLRNRTGWAAAAILLIAMLSIYRFWFESKNKQKNTSSIVISEILPGRNGALLTLSNGGVISLDTISDGEILLEGGIRANIVGGQLQYDESNTTVVYNTVSTPKGRQFQLTLGDGTKVWLNSGSSIYFPTKFDSLKRIVHVTGEVYFEVTPKKKQTFVVKTRQQMEIEVLGTHFNISSYENEDAIHTTLVEGSVQVRYRQKVSLLEPGSQARVYPSKDDATITLINNVNLEKIMAWKNGVFNFEGADLQEVMKQLERWYEIDVQYQGKIPNVQFFGEISREEKLADVLNALKESGIKFKLEKGRRLIVLP